jgi:tRNA (guanine26-N2/guanine27-N2)-dimethyltransferase
MDEEGMELETGALFFNPHMRLSRSMGSLSVGAIGKKLSVLDGFAASGVRGLRYAKENSNVETVSLLDIWRIAPPIIMRNAENAGIRNAKAFNEDFNAHCVSNSYDFVEIDPFGTPVPFLSNAVYSMRKKKGGYLSFTATDVAVLCGENARACRKKYGSKNLRNEFTHEVGARILLKTAAEFCAQWDFGMTPLYTLSHRHYIKVLIRLDRSAELASDTVQQTGHVSYCYHCGHRETGKFPVRVCANCKRDADYGGPLWLGELHDKEFLAKMSEINSERNYADKEAIADFLALLQGECGMPMFYYNIHEMCARLGGSAPKTSALIKKLAEMGYPAVRTHFSAKGIKTGAGVREIALALGH